MARWLRWAALIIFLFLSVVFVGVTIRTPAWGNAIPTIIIVITLFWVISGFKKKKQIQN